MIGTQASRLHIAEQNENDRAAKKHKAARSSRKGNPADEADQCEMRRRISDVPLSLLAFLSRFAADPQAGTNRNRRTE
ncbi:MAG: hypothetical protein DWQ47_12400 [Acidobacteria bacterium]|nr:MAG: hypothetical protein DWQ32_14815 [Acidobacteriota bacterium]REJ98369.1 MAG: hypothetical protein DWQ38_17615 [Acidobacteriota bacterium]REK17113.1 MAG: hypothetical protein DWQ43_02660 [Acidobacteriota bacterium]REK43023.1 MAG: hypothetical protein DWQ47_12400 [Acidobacteriota bacterium]